MSSFTAQREALMRVQDIAANISGELSAEHSRQDKTGKRFAPETPETIERQLSDIAALFRQLAPVAEQISIAKSKAEEELHEGEAGRITANALAVTRSLTGEVEVMESIVKKEVEFLQVRLNPLIRELENNVIRATSPSVATAARDYLEAVREYNYGFDLDVTRFERERAARDRLQIAVGKALKAGPFMD